MLHFLPNSGWAIGNSTEVTGQHNETSKWMSTRPRYATTSHSGYIPLEIVYDLFTSLPGKGQDVALAASRGVHCRLTQLEQLGLLLGEDGVARAGEPVVGGRVKVLTSLTITIEIPS